MHPVDEILDHFDRVGTSRFDEKNVTQLDHALQCADQAEQAGASPALITACLLHDIGHLINPDARSAIRQGEDAQHEIRALHYLQDWFNDDVLHPIRWHVDAKRYLTATDEDYFSTLSEGSVHSLAVQGGPYSQEEVGAFEAIPYFKDAVQLRRWDEGAKRPGAQMPRLAHFRPYIEAALKPEIPRA